MIEWYTIKEKRPPFMEDIAVWDGKRVYAAWNEALEDEDVALVTHGGKSCERIKKWCHLPSPPTRYKVTPKTKEKKCL